MEKKREETRARNELVISPFARNSMQQKEKSNRGSLSCGKIRPIKPLVKMGIREVKPLISPSSKLNVSSGSEEENG